MQGPRPGCNDFSRCCHSALSLKAQAKRPFDLVGFSEGILDRDLSVDSAEGRRRRSGKARERAAMAEVHRGAHGRLTGAIGADENGKKATNPRVEDPVGGSSETMTRHRKTGSAARRERGG